MDSALRLPITRFTETFIEANGLDRNGFQNWIFFPGMLFNSPHKWWGDHGLRDFPHEGIDLCLYRDGSNQTRCFDENIRIPVIHDGAVRSIFTDYLGKAVIVEHEAADDKTKRFLSIYAHTRLWAGVEIGLTLRKGDVIATIADTSSSKAGIRPHLHFSLGFPSAKLKYDAFVWNTIRKPEMVTLLDPIDIIDFSYEEAPSENPICQGRY
jgi:murein DD-endopeptidase MepM/ murein hydrolase activator NlpD